LVQSTLCYIGTQLRSSERGQSANFSTSLLWPNGCSGSMKMPLGTEVGLGLRDIVFDVDPATFRKKGVSHRHPIFGPCLLWPNDWMDEDAAWYGSRPRPRPQCTKRGLNSRERGTAAPLFSAHVYCGHGRPSQLAYYLLLSSCTSKGKEGRGWKGGRQGAGSGVSTIGPLGPCPRLGRRPKM